MPLTSDPWLETDSSGRVSPVRRGALVTVLSLRLGRGGFTPLPNVECVHVNRQEGTDPGSAWFRYNLASGLDGAPVSIETALGTGSTGTYIIDSGDRLVVRATRPDGVTECLFDGEAVDFGMGLDPELEEVRVGAIGIGWRALDNVIAGAKMRDAGDPKALHDIQTMLPAQFNPKGRPNCTPVGYSSGSTSNGKDRKYPVFLDPSVIKSPDLRTYWTLPKACRYLLYTANASEQFVKNPNGSDLDQLLVVKAVGGDKFADITCPDTPITGKDWPGTVNRLVSENGFGTVFELTTDDAGLPVTSFRIFRQTEGALKSLYLAARGTPFDPSLFNVQGSGLHRDLSSVVTQVTVNGDLHRWEASFILCPGFPMVSTDGDDANIANFGTDSPSYNTTRHDSYRLYIFDECGEGVYKIGTNGLVVADNTLDGLFGQGLYVKRRRVPIGDLITRDSNKLPLEATLSVSTDYAGGYPKLWDGTGTWQPVATSTWRLCRDRIGIYITDKNPENWEIGQPKTSGMPFPDGIIHGVKNQSALVAGKSFWVRVTCVVEADRCLSKVAVPRGLSPLNRVINRVVDASDRFHNEYVDFPSEFNKSGGNDLNPRDDSDAALAEAQSLRAGQEAGVLDGPITIPRLTTYYKIGDRIDKIEGRNLGLRTDTGPGDPVYPVVVGVSWDFTAESQTTTLELSDAGVGRDRYRRPAARPTRKPYTPGGSGSRQPGELMGGGGGGGGGGGPEPGVLMGGGGGGMGGSA